MLNQVEQHKSWCTSQNQQTLGADAETFFLTSSEALSQQQQNNSVVAFKGHFTPNSFHEVCFSGHQASVLTGI